MSAPRAFVRPRFPRRTQLVAAALLGLALAPAQGDEHGQREPAHDQGKARQGAPHRAADHRDQDHRERDKHGYYRGDYYPQPLYVPPVVQYAPPQSPGINLFVPLDIHLR